MRPTECFEAVSAGVILDGDTAVLSFLTNQTLNDREATIVLTRDLLRSLQRNIRVRLRGTAALRGRALSAAAASGETPPP